MKFEILDDEGNVINTIIASLEFVEANYPNHYRQVEQTAVQQPKRHLTKLEFLDRFTDVELAGILDAAKVSTLIAVWVKKLDVATEIHLYDERTIYGVNALETAGLLGQGRAAEILEIK